MGTQSKHTEKLFSVALILGFIGIASLILWMLNGDQKLEEIKAKIIADGGILDINDLPSLYPKDIEYFDGPAEETFLAFVLSPEAAGPLSGVKVQKDWPWYETATYINKLPVITPEEIALGVAMIGEQQELIDHLKAIADLPLTSPEDVIQLSKMKRSIIRTDVPNLLALLAYSNLLKWDAYVAYKNGDFDRTLRSCQAIIQIGQHLCATACTISHMIGIAISRIPSEFLNTLIIDTPFTNSTVASFIEYLDNQRPAEFFKLTTRMEILSFSELIPTGDLLYDDNSSFNLPLLESYDETVGLTLLHEYIKSLDTPYWDWDTEEFENYKESVLSWKAPNSKQFVENLGRMRESLVAHQNYILELRIALAINRFNNKTNTYPTTLQDLIPEFLQETPINPYTGDPSQLEYFFLSESKAKHEEERAKYKSRYLSHFTISSGATEKRLRIH